MQLKEFFYFQKSDRQVLLVLLGVLVVLALLFWRLGAPPPTEVDRLTQAQSDSASNRFDAASRVRTRNPYYTYSAGNYQQQGQIAIERFPFDPNTADSTQLLRLGLRPWQVRNIYKYRASGGIYRRPSDFARLYGLTAKEYRELEPFIRISSDYLPAAEVYGQSVHTEKLPRDSFNRPQKLGLHETIELNQSDTTQLKKVPGIGSAYAKAIFNYGKRLGGYYSVEQIRDLEYIPEEVIAYLRVDHPQLKKLNLNKLTLSQLRKHPYISYYQAKAVVDYRRLRGPLKSLNDLQLLKDFTPHAIQRLEPYVEF